MKVQGIRESCDTLCLMNNVSCVSIPIFILSKTEAGIESQENIAALKRAMTHRHAGWSSKDWTIPHPTCRRPPLKMPDRARKTNEKARNLEQSGRRFPTRWRDWVCRERKEKHSGQSCKDSAKRETEIFKVSGCMADDSKGKT